jgi:glycosyltransferase involved in cell wall biosynthesis
MRVLHLIEGSGGGADTHVLTMARELARRQIEIVIVFVTPGHSVTLAKRQGLNFVLIPCRFFPDWHLVWKLSRLIKEKKVNIIHTHTIRGNFYGRISALLSMQHPICVATVHSFLIDELGGRLKIGLTDRLLYIREISTWPLVDHFIAVSKPLASKLIEDGIPRSKIEVISHGTPVPEVSNAPLTDNGIRLEFSIGGEETVVGIIGRLVPVKNHALFLTAAQEVLESASKVRFLVIGDGALRAHLEELTRNLGISDSVVFAGWRNDMAECLRAIDMLVLCSTTETQGLVILEAMSFCKPVIATDINEVGETVIDGETGLLVPPYDPHALAKAILKLVNNKTLAKTFGKRGRQLVEERYPLERMVSKTAALYEALHRSRQ